MFSHVSLCTTYTSKVMSYLSDWEEGCNVTSHFQYISWSCSYLVLWYETGEVTYDSLSEYDLLSFHINIVSLPYYRILVTKFGGIEQNLGSE